MKKFFAIFATVLVVGVGAQAGFLIDPYMGYALSGSTNSGAKVSGSDMGLRLGLSTMGFGYGVDATVSGTYKHESLGVTTNYNPSHMGLFLSYKFPIIFRGYATYFLNSKITSGSTSITGNGTKIGIQYTGLPFIALGVEMYTMNYTEQDVAGVKSSTSGSESQTRLAISVPFDI